MYSPNACRINKASILMTFRRNLLLDANNDTEYIDSSDKRHDYSKEMGQHNIEA